MYLSPYDIAGIISIVLGIVINCIFASKFKKISVAKGYTEKNHTFALCFFLGIIGYIYVSALPDLTLREQNRQLVLLLSKPYTTGGASLGNGYCEYTKPKKSFGLFKRR